MNHILYTVNTENAKYHKYRHFYFNDENALERLLRVDFCFIGAVPRGWYVKYGVHHRKRDPDKIRPKGLDVKQKAY